MRLPFCTVQNVSSRSVGGGWKLALVYEIFEGVERGMLQPQEPRLGRLDDLRRLPAVHDAHPTPWNRTPLAPLAALLAGGRAIDVHGVSGVHGAVGLHGATGGMSMGHSVISPMQNETEAF